MLPNVVDVVLLLLWVMMAVVFLDGRTEAIADVVDPVDMVVLALVGGWRPLDSLRAVHQEGLVQREMQRRFAFIAL